MRSLAETQRLFWALATRSPQADASGAHAIFRSTLALDADVRIAIYADMYFWRQIDALREAFPKLAALMGDTAFNEMAEQYVRAHPSEHPDLGQRGRRMASFLAEHGSPRPDIPDLAALEWARCDVFGEEDAPVATLDSFVVMDVATIAASPLPIVPALRLLKLRHEISPLWTALDSGQEPPQPRPGPTAIAVWRKGFAVFHVTLSPEESSALERARGGATVEEICDAFADRPDAQRMALAAIGSWFAEEWIAAG